MSKKRLYIVGNGFDLYHGIPSQYWRFKEYVRARDASLVAEVERYVPAEDSWADLESALAAFDVEAVVDDKEHFMASYGAEDWSDAGHHAFQQEVERTVEGLSTELKRYFGDWIRSLPIPTVQTATIKLQTLDPSAAFLTFNYTATLQSLYGITESSVLFIHGCAAREEDELILGHAWNPADRPSLNRRADIEDLDTRLIEGHDMLDQYFGATFKPSAELIVRHGAFFRSLASISEVVVLGHSLSEVDAAYFHALFAQPAVRAAAWFVAVRPEDDWADRRAALEELAHSHAAGLVASPIAWKDL